MTSFASSFDHRVRPTRLLLCLMLLSHRAGRRRREDRHSDTPPAQLFPAGTDAEASTQRSASLPMTKGAPLSSPYFDDEEAFDFRSEVVERSRAPYSYPDSIPLPLRLSLASSSLSLPNMSDSAPVVRRSCASSLSPLELHHHRRGCHPSLARRPGLTSTLSLLSLSLGSLPSAPRWLRPQ